MPEAAPPAGTKRSRNISTETRLYMHLITSFNYFTTFFNGTMLKFTAFFKKEQLGAILFLKNIPDDKDGKASSLEYGIEHLHFMPL